MLHPAHAHTGQAQSHWKPLARLAERLLAPPQSPSASSLLQIVALEWPCLAHSYSSPLQKIAEHGHDSHGCSASRSLLWPFAMSFQQFCQAGITCFGATFHSGFEDSVAHFARLINYGSSHRSFATLLRQNRGHHGFARVAVHRFGG